MKDLTCELPQYFNIRHTDRGILTKKTKRTGTNLHCIMAFKKIQSSFATPIFMPADPSADMAPTLSEVEELNSSDSDLPSSPNSYGSQRGVCGDTGGAEPSVEEVDLGTVDSGTFSAIHLSGADLESSGKGSTDGAMSGEMDVGTKLSVDDLVLEEGSSLVSDEAVLTSTPRGLIMTDSNGIRHENTGVKSTEDLSLSPTTSEVPVNQDGQEISPPAINLRRSGTFTKEKPTLRVEQRRIPSSDSESSMEITSEGNPVLDGNNSPQGWSKLRDSPAQDPSSGGSSPTGPPIGTLKRSNTFTKEKPTLESYDGLDRSSPQEWILSQDSPGPDYYSGSSPDTSPKPTLKRSNTFTKEKPSTLSSSLTDEVDLDETLKASDFF